MVKIINIIGDQQVAANRQLSPDNAALNLVYFQQQKPIVPAELNFAQQIQNENRRNLAANVGRPGFFSRDAYTASGTSLVVPDSWALVNGEVLHIAGGTGTQSDPYTSITRSLTPPPATGVSYDVVFLEFWYAEVSALGQADVASESIYVNGQNAGVDLASNADYVIRDPLVTAVSETTRRVQLRWRVRVFNSTILPLGDGLVGGTNPDASVYVGPGAMAASGVNNAGYTFSPLTGINTGMYRAGAGLLSDSTTFKDTTGYVYALPMAVVSHAAGEGNLVVANQLTDKRRSASPIGNISTEGANLILAGDDVVFRTIAGVETGRVIGSTSPYTIRSARLQSTIVTGTAPLVIASQTMVPNLNVQYLGVGAGFTPTPAGNATGNIPVSNGVVNTNLNADMVDNAHVGTGPGNIIILDNGGTYNGKINPLYIPAAAAPVSVAYLTDTRTGGIYTPGNVNGHPSSDFLLKSELPSVGVADGIGAAARASYAVSAGTANSATSAQSVPIGDGVSTGVIGAVVGTINKTATADNTGGTIVLRDGAGGFSAGTISATLSGAATTAGALARTGLAAEPLSFASGFTMLILPQGSYNRGYDRGGGFYEPTTGGSGAAWKIPGLFSFMLEPGRMRVKDSSVGIHIKIAGVVYRNNFGTDGARAPLSYSLRIRDPRGTVQFLANISFANIPSQGGHLEYNLRDANPDTLTLDYTAVTTRALDGMWTIENTIPDTETMQCGNIYLQIYTTNGNIGN